MSEEMDPMLNKHEHQINDDILPRLEHLEKAQKETTAKIDEMQKGQVQLENTVLKETKTMQELQRSGQEKVDEVFKILVDLVKGDRKADTKISIAKLDTRTKIVGAILGALFGAGGLLELIRVLQYYLQ